MPGRSGLDFLADIRSLDRNDGGHVPVIAMTAYVLDQVVVDAGFQRLLRKPFAPDQLLAAIDSIYGGPGGISFSHWISVSGYCAEKSGLAGQRSVSNKAGTT